MANKEIKTRIQNKNDTSENWAKTVNFVPLKGEIIIYNDTLQFKIGDGTSLLSQLEFVDKEFTTEEISNLYMSSSVELAEEVTL